MKTMLLASVMFLMAGAAVLVPKSQPPVPVQEPALPAPPVVVARQAPALVPEYLLHGGPPTLACRMLPTTKLLARFIDTSGTSYIMSGSWPDPVTGQNVPFELSTHLDNQSGGYWMRATGPTGYPAFGKHSFPAKWRLKHLDGTPVMQPELGAGIPLLDSF